MNKGVEIERKWIVTDFPKSLSCNAAYTTKSRYLAITENTEIRIQHSILPTDNKYKLTYKYGAGLLRREEEFYLSEKEYDEMVCFSGYDPIVKQLREYYLDGHKIYVSRVDPGTPNEFLYGEIEFENIEAANSYTLPFKNWTEVTGDPHYAMSNYWDITRWQDEKFLNPALPAKTEHDLQMEALTKFLTILETADKEDKDYKWVEEEIEILSDNYPCLAHLTLSRINCSELLTEIVDKIKTKLFLNTLDGFLPF